MAMTREEANARKLQRRHARLAAMTEEERDALRMKASARRREIHLAELYAEFAAVTAELRGR